MFLDNEDARSSLKASESRATFFIALVAATACILMVFGLMGTAKAEVPIASGAVSASTDHTVPGIEVASLAVAAQSAETTASAVGRPTLHQAAIGDRGLLMAGIAAAFGLMLVGGRALWRNHVSKPIRAKIDRMRIVAREAAIAPERIACEIRRSADETAALSGDLARQLHEHGFKAAIDGYNGDDSDLERLKRLEPDLVKFDSAWLSGFATNSAGLALLRVLIGQFHRDGILPIVSGIEEPWQIELCRDLGSPLMEGYLIARPELAPTGFNLHFPEDDFAPLETATENGDPLAERSGRRGAATFGKRGA